MAFAIYGNNPDINEGALRQAELFTRWSKLGPIRWQLFYYVGSSAPPALLDKLEALGARIFRVDGRPEDRTAGFWRHHALLPEFDFYLFRDAVHRLSAREQQAVEEFVNSDADFHFMRDHPTHYAPILPGLWGCSRRGRDRIMHRMPDLVPMEFFRHVNRWLGTHLESNDFPHVDEVWYWRHLWPRARHRALIHSELAVSRFHGRLRTHCFPVPRNAREFVGQGFRATDEAQSQEMLDHLDSLSWAYPRQVRNTHNKPPEKVCVKLACGLGNNIFQMVAGLALAKRLSDRSGCHHSCEMLIPDPIDFSRGYAICETLGGHLRSDQHFRREHMDFGLPDPDDLPAIFPKLLWRDIQFPKAAYPGDLTEITSSQYFKTSRYYEIQGDDRYADPAGDGHFRVVNCHFIPSFYPFPQNNWYPEVLGFREDFDPGANVKHYIHCKYRLSPDSQNDLIGVHIRNDLRVADIHRSDVVPLSWYLDCVDAAAAAAGPGTPILIVSNRVSANHESYDAHSELVENIKRNHPEHPLLISSLEPYYIDFFLLRLCSYLVISCSTFGFGAGLTSHALKAMYVPNSFSDRHFMDGVFPDFCKFLPD
ncbi:hypothetical protein KHP57_15735 [Algiphilus sp. NNCM1]|nr:hypothetical protein [Algiphilus acroporae]MCI5043577.1 hypothetical protein [Aquisalinus sp.]